MKTSAKYFGLAVGPYARQHEPKWFQNYFTYDVTHKKSATPNQKFFFRVQTTRLANPFEPLKQLSCAISEGARALVKQPKTAGFRLSYAGSQKCYLQ